jgi:hypothetical protein
VKERCLREQKKVYILLMKCRHGAKILKKSLVLPKGAGFDETPSNFHRISVTSVNPDTITLWKNVADFLIVHISLNVSN